MPCRLLQHFLTIFSAFFWLAFDWESGGGGIERSAPLPNQSTLSLIVYSCVNTTFYFTSSAFKFFSSLSIRAFKTSGTVTGFVFLIVISTAFFSSSLHLTSSSLNVGIFSPFFESHCNIVVKSQIYLYHFLLCHM